MHAPFSTPFSAGRPSRHDELCWEEEEQEHEEQEEEQNEQNEREEQEEQEEQDENEQEEKVDAMYGISMRQASCGPPA